MKFFWAVHTLTFLHNFTTSSYLPEQSRPFQPEGHEQTQFWRFTVPPFWHFKGHSIRMKKKIFDKTCDFNGTYFISISKVSQGWLNLPHKLHIFGHFLAINSRFVEHNSLVRLLPHSLSKLSQSPSRTKLHYIGKRWKICSLCNLVSSRFGAHCRNCLLAFCKLCNIFLLELSYWIFCTVIWINNGSIIRLVHALIPLFCDDVLSFLHVTQ